MNKNFLTRNSFSTVSNELYIGLLAEMEEHAKNSIAIKNSGSFVPSIIEFQEFYRHISYINLSLSFSEDLIVQGFKIYSQTQAYSYTNNIKAYIVQSIQTINPDNPDFEKFIQEYLDEILSKLLEGAKCAIHAVFNNAKFLGINFPKSQKAILAIVKLFSELFNVLIEKITDFINTLFVNLEELFKTKKVWLSINEAFTSIIQYIDDWYKVSSHCTSNNNLV